MNGLPVRLTEWCRYAISTRRPDDADDPIAGLTAQMTNLTARLTVATLPVAQEPA